MFYLVFKTISQTNFFHFALYNVPFFRYISFMIFTNLLSIHAFFFKKVNSLFPTNEAIQLIVLYTSFCFFLVSLESTCIGLCYLVFSFSFLICHCLLMMKINENEVLNNLQIMTGFLVLANIILKQFSCIFENNYSVFLNFFIIFIDKKHLLSFYDIFSPFIFDFLNFLLYFYVYGTKNAKNGQFLPIFVV